jgi:hypothetical protein
MVVGSEIFSCCGMEAYRSAGIYASPPGAEQEGDRIPVSFSGSKDLPLLNELLLCLIGLSKL